MIAAMDLRRLLDARAGRRAGIVVVAMVFGLASQPATLFAGSPAPRHHGHHCEHCQGACGPHCPVRPGLYGFYGTQWRQWPGQGFMSSQQLPAATPVTPPRLAVPGPDEESLRPRTEDAIVPLPESSRPEPESEPEMFTPPAKPTPEPEEKKVLPPPPPPAPLPVAPPSNAPEDENLFNTRYRPKSMGKLSIVLGRTTSQNESGDVQPATHVRPADRKSSPQSVPRVPFDPAAEVHEIRIRIK